MKNPSKWKKHLPLAILLSIIPLAIFYSALDSWHAGAAIAAKSKDIPAKIEEAYEGIEPKDDRMILERQLIEAGVVQEKIGETKSSVCYVRAQKSSSKETFIVPYFPTVGYSHECYVRVTSGFYTGMAKNEVYDGLRKDVFKDYYVNGLYRLTPVDAEDCNLILADDVRVKFVPANSSASFFENRHDFVYFDECARPSIHQGTGSVEYGTELSIKVIEEIPETVIDNTRNQIWLEEDIDYFRQSIGCKEKLISISDTCDKPRYDLMQ